MVIQVGQKNVLAQYEDFPKGQEDRSVLNEIHSYLEINSPVIISFDKKEIL